MDAAVDNCATVANADQRDTDGDGAVNFTDLGILKARFFCRPGPSGITNICE